MVVQRYLHARFRSRSVVYGVGAGVSAIRYQTPLNLLINRSPFGNDGRVTESFLYELAWLDKVQCTKVVEKGLTVV